VHDSLETAVRHSNGSSFKITKKKTALPILYEKSLHPES
jgi:hypothetical protein